MAAAPRSAQRVSLVTFLQTRRVFKGVHLILNAALFLAIFLFVSHLSGSVQAYLAPGTGSVALELILGGIVAAFATVRLYWDRLEGLRRRAPANREATPRRF